MALIVEDGTSVAGADSYDSQANVEAYLRDMGYLGTWQAGSPLVNGAVAANASQMNVDGGSGSETAYAGDRFQVASVVGTFTVSEDSVADSGGDALIKFSPVAPTGGFADDAAVSFLALTEAQIRRGARALDMLYSSRLQGVRSDSDQGLQWPRRSVIDEDGNLIASNAIPIRWKHAAFEMARIVPASHSVDLPSWLKRVKAGSAEVEFATAQKARTVLGYVRELVSPYLDAHAFRVMRA